MHGLIADLRDLAISRAGALAPRWQPVPLATVAERVRAMTAPKLRVRGLRIEIDLGDAPEVVEADPHLLRRLVPNLVVNAIDFSPEGGVIHIRAAADGDHYALQVDDDGPGVAPEKREHIFDLYAREPDGSERVSRGIGLAFCRAAAEAHGGTIAVHGREPHGSSFRVRLPLRRP
jgi:signal transduction histidine kinase